MDVYGLYGKSGTGKSYKSSEIIARYHIDAVLDDGILIMDKQRVAGKSAKMNAPRMRQRKQLFFHRLPIACKYIIIS